MKLIKEKWYRVKYGFSALDQVSIQDSELEQALAAQKLGLVVRLAGQQINGKYIISIVPHWHKYTGWFNTYEPSTGDDFLQIERDCPKDLDETLRLKRERVDFLITNHQERLIGKNVEIPGLGTPEEKLATNPELEAERKRIANNFKIN